MSQTGGAADGRADNYADTVVARIERLPTSWWQIRTRIIVGVATFFDAFDSLAIATVLPVLVPMWKLSGQDVGFLISAGFVGQLLGALLFGWVAERYGRMPAMIWSIATFAVMSFVCAFAWDYNSFLIFRTLQGVGLGGEVPVAAAYISELTKAKGRGRFVLLYELVFPVGLVAAALAGRWIVPHFGWHYMFLIGALPAVLALVLRVLLPESPRWLAVHGRRREAEEAIALIERETEKATGKPLPPPQVVVHTKERRASWADLFGPQYLQRTLVVWLMWFAAYLVNYGLSTWMPTVYTRLYRVPLETALQYSLITTVVGLVGATICALVVDYLGRRLMFTVAFAGAAGGLIVLGLLGAQTADQVLLFISISYFFASAINLGVYLYTPELYPTRTRALAVGTASAWLRLASIIGPIVVGWSALSTGWLTQVFIGFGLVALFAAVVTALFAVETKGRVLEEVSP
jgi:putative MFS transporter